MNQAHLDLLVSDGWRSLLADHVLPFAFGDREIAALGDDVVEVGPGPGLTTDLLRADLQRLTAVELDPELAGALSERLAGTNVEVVEADASAMPFDAATFTGAVSFTMLHHVRTSELQDRLFTDVLRVLRPGGLLVASDSVASANLEALHDDDIYNPVDPAGLSRRLDEIGFTEVDVVWNDFAWRCHARRPA